MPTSPRLAIIIPAYKAAFLKETLESIRLQTNQEFSVYIGDDSSPEDLKSICDLYRDKIKMVYHRFEKNLGSKSIVQQWNRCVQLSNEPWVWLFSDDDLMSETCVARFYQELSVTQEYYNVYRFNTNWMDKDENIIHYNPEHPQIESSINFISQKFNLERMSTACEYIFSRQAFIRENGFIDFPVAWCSDDASWAAFAEDKGIYTIKGPKVHWRISGLNISTSNAKYKKEKIKALFSYFYWIAGRYTIEVQEKVKFHKEQQYFLYQQLAELHTHFTFLDFLYIGYHSRQLWRTGWRTSMKKLRKLNKYQ